MSAPDSGVFGRYAPTYDDTVNSAIRASGEDVGFFARLKAELARKALAPTPPKTILDFGCGIGSTVRELRQTFPSSRITGCDPSRRSVDTARARSREDPRVRFTWFSSGRLPFDDASFDASVASCVLHHIERDAHAHWIRELRRVVNPGGALLVFEHNPYNPLTRRVVRACPFDEGVELLPPPYTRRLLRRQGFRTERPHFYFFFPRALRALRRFEESLRNVPLGGQYLLVGRRPAGPAPVYCAD